MLVWTAASWIFNFFLFWLARISICYLVQLYSKSTKIVINITVYFQLTSLWNGRIFDFYFHCCQGNFTLPTTNMPPSPSASITINLPLVKKFCNPIAGILGAHRYWNFGSAASWKLGSIGISGARFFEKSEANWLFKVHKNCGFGSCSITSSNFWN